MGLMLFLVALGLGNLILKSPFILSGLKWCGIGFLLWLSWRIAMAGWSKGTAKHEHVGFREAAAFQWLNPKAWLVCAGAVGAYFQAEAGSAFGRAVTLALLFILAALPSCFVWLAAGAGMQGLLYTERAARVFNMTTGTLLAGSILLFVW
jgi:threonine/homoserine/homoserine lactone efflux protein